MPADISAPPALSGAALAPPGARPAAGLSLLGCADSAALLGERQSQQCDPACYN